MKQADDIYAPIHLLEVFAGCHAIGRGFQRYMRNTIAFEIKADGVRTIAVLYVYNV